MPEAGRYLEALIKEWKLHDQYQKEVSRMMLFVSVAKNDAPAVVRCFEDLKDPYPDLVIPFDKIEHARAHGRRATSHLSTCSRHVASGPAPAPTCCAA